MPRGLPLNQYEKGEITVLINNGKSINYIAKHMNRSRELIQRYVKNPVEYGQTKRPGRPRKLSERDTRRIIKTASNSMNSSMQIRRQCGVNVSKSTILRTLKRSNYIVKKKMNKVPRLLDRHKKMRLDFGRNNMSTDWKKVSTIEKIFRYQ